MRAATRDLAQQSDDSTRSKWLRLELALVLAEATGRRFASIAALRWDDVQQDPPSIRWRLEHDKRRREAVIPMPEALALEVRRPRAQLGVFDDGPTFPAQRGGSWSTDVLSQLLVIAERHAGVPKLAGGLWHPYRRKWATSVRRFRPLMKEAGGWQDTATLLACYQQADDATLLEVVAAPHGLIGRKLARNS